MTTIRTAMWLVVILSLTTTPAGLEPGTTNEPGTGNQEPGRRFRYSRIISLVPAVTEMLFALGAGNAVAGISSYDRYPPEALKRPRVGGLIDPDFERILSLRPDLVITYGTQSELIDRLRRANIEIYNYEHAGLADITTTIRSLGQRIGIAEAAERLAASIEQQLAEVRARVAGRPRPRTVLIIGRELGTLRGLHASAGVGFLHDILVTAGGTDVFDDVKRQNLQVSTEVLLARAPEVILELHPPEGWTPERLASERAVWQQLASLPAVRNGRIHVLTDHRLIVPGPRVGDAARMFADLLHR